MRERETHTHTERERERERGERELESIQCNSNLIKSPSVAGVVHSVYASARWCAGEHGATNFA